MPRSRHHPVPYKAAPLCWLGLVHRACPHAVWRALALLAGFALLAGCAGGPLADGVGGRADPAALAAAEAAVQQLEPPRPRSPRRSNAEIARDILELTFQLESGRPLERLSRFEGPVGVALTGPVPPFAEADLARLLARLRAEAGITVDRVADPAQAGIVVAFVPLARMRRAVPRAACFVVPGVGNWDEFRRLRPGSAVDWASMTQRERVSVFIPADAPPQEVRDCLHEEIAQALGPLNDSFRLTDSVFNDDNFHTVLTGFDMLVLKVLNDPALRSGLSQAEVRRRLPEILGRLNPAGGNVRALAPPRPTPRAWIAAIETALAPATRAPARLAAVADAIAIANAAGWQDNRAAFGLYLRARLTPSRDPATALADLAAARRLWAGLPDTGVHLAQVDLALADIALGAERPADALALTEAALPAALQAQNAALAASLLALQAEALARAGDAEAARARGLDSLFWARYGLGGRALTLRPVSPPDVPSGASRGGGAPASG